MQTIDAAVGDFNADGVPDVAVANTGFLGGPNGSIGTIGVFVGDGVGGFAPMVEFPDLGCYAIEVADLDGDGLDDFAGTTLAGVEMMYQAP